jgi:hypothetical protein
VTTLLASRGDPFTIRPFMRSDFAQYCQSSGPTHVNVILSSVASVESLYSQLVSHSLCRKGSSPSTLHSATVACCVPAFCFEIGASEATCTDGRRLRRVYVAHKRKDSSRGCGRPPTIVHVHYAGVTGLSIMVAGRTALVQRNYRT